MRCCRFTHSRLRLQTSPNQVDLDLTPPGNEFGMRSFISLNGGTPLVSPDVYFATRMHWAVDLIIDRDKDKNSLTALFGRPGSEVSQRRSIQLVGPPNLFPSFAIPDQLPSPGSYTRAIFTEGTEPETIDKIGVCPSTP